MTSTEAINKIKVLLGLDVETSKESFEATGKLADGTEIHTPTEIEVGAMLHIIQEDGSMVPAPEGTHTLEDGRTVAVDAAGVITSIEEAAAEAEVEETEEALSEEATEETTTEELAEETEESVEMEEKEEETTMSAEEIVAAVVEAMSPVMKDVEEMKAKLMSLSAEFNAFSDAPAAKPVRNNFAEQAKMNASNAEERLERVAKLRKQFKK